MLVIHSFHWNLLDELQVVNVCSPPLELLMPIFQAGQGCRIGSRSSVRLSSGRLRRTLPRAVSVALAGLLATVMLAVRPTSSGAQVESVYGHIEYQGTAVASYKDAGNTGRTSLDWAAETTEYLELGAPAPELKFTRFTGLDEHTAPENFSCKGTLTQPAGIPVRFIPPDRFSEWLGVPIPPDTIAIFVQFPSLGMQTDNPTCGGGPKYAFDPNYNSRFPAAKQQDFTNAFQAPVFLPIDKSDAENDYNFDYVPDTTGVEMHIHSVVRVSLFDPPPATE